MSRNLLVQRKFRIGLLAVLLAVGISGGSLKLAHASYLDNEVTYEGNVAQSFEYDEDDGTVDGICHDEDPNGNLTVKQDCGLKDDDDVSQEIPIGFPFSFYGDVKQKLYLNVNGVMHFGCASDRYTNSTIPTVFQNRCAGNTAADGRAAILAFWDDIITTPIMTQDPTTGAWEWSDNYPTILSKTVGQPGSRKFIAQWTNMHLYDNPDIPLGTFQIILYEGSNEFQIQYRNLLGDPARASGSSATIGIQKDSNAFDQYSYNGSSPITQGQAIRYIPNGNGGYQTANTNATYDPVYLSFPGGLGIPQLSSPANGASAVAINPLMQWQATDHADAYTLIIASDSNLTNVVYQKTNLHAINHRLETNLNPSTTYYWFIKASNQVGETISAVHSFTTGTQTAEDNDGIPAAIEMAAPNAGDGNNDGRADDTQDNVASFINPLTSRYVTVATDNACVLSQISANASSANQVHDESYTYPEGLVNFAASCGIPGYTANLKLYFYGAQSDLLLRKYNPNTHQYQTVTSANQVIENIGGQPVVVVSYQLVDGGSLDTDGIVNGIVVDPIGFAIANPTIVNAAAGAASGTEGLAETGINQINLLFGAFTITAISIIALSRHSLSRR